MYCFIYQEKPWKLWAVILCKMLFGELLMTVGLLNDIHLLRGAISQRRTETHY